MFYPDRISPGVSFILGYIRSFPGRIEGRKSLGAVVSSFAKSDIPLTHFILPICVHFLCFCLHFLILKKSLSQTASNTTFERCEKLATGTTFLMGLTVASAAPNAGKQENVANQCMMISSSFPLPLAQNSASSFIIAVMNLLNREADNKI